MANVWAETTGVAGRWRVCWRQEVRDENGAARKVKGSTTVTGAGARDEVLVRARRALEVDGVYVHEPPPEQRVASLESAAAEWIRHRAVRGAAVGTIAAHAGVWTRLGKDLRALERIPADAPIPVTVLTRTLMTRLQERWQAEGLGAVRTYTLGCTLLRVWVWAADDPTAWPSVPPPPRDASTVLPLPPLRGSAPDAPTPAECDAVCRRAARSEVRDLGSIVAVLRLTGLRIGQVLAMKVEDVDLARGTLIVSTGKSRREKANKRTIPLHQSLMALLSPHVRDRVPSEFFFPPARGGSGPRSLGEGQVRDLWLEATEAGEVRREVWDPPVLKKKRPHHAFRAGLLAALTEAGVSEAVRFALVGHEPRTVEGRHYSAPTVDGMRAAVDRLPPIDWVGRPTPAAPPLVALEGGVAAG